MDYSQFTEPFEPLLHSLSVSLFTLLSRFTAHSASSGHTIPRFPHCSGGIYSVWDHRRLTSTTLICTTFVQRRQHNTLFLPARRQGNRGGPNNECAHTAEGLNPGLPGDVAHDGQE